MRRNNAGSGLFGTRLTVGTETAREKWGVIVNGTVVIQSTDETPLDAARIKKMLYAVGELQMAGSGQALYINKEVSDPNRQAACERYTKALKLIEDVQETHHVAAERRFGL